MPLVDLQTSLKDLKYGHDEYSGGSSNQPYVKTRIPATNEPLQTSFDVSNSYGDGFFDKALLVIESLINPDISSGFKAPNAGTGGDDFVLRGGTLFPGKVLSDEERLGKFFFSSKGLFFTLKQNLLSRTAVRTEASSRFVNEDVYLPTSTLAQAGVVGVGLHLNKQGLNPIPGLDGAIETYRNQVQYNQYQKVGKESWEQLTENNRLAALYRLKIQPNYPPEYTRLKETKSIITINGITIDKDDPVNLLEYSGGPGSVLGIGKTKIPLHCGQTRNRCPNPDDTDRFRIVFEQPVRLQDIPKCNEIIIEKPKPPKKRRRKKKKKVSKPRF